MSAVDAPSLNRCAVFEYDVISVGETVRCGDRWLQSKAQATLCVISVRLLRVVGFCVRSARKSSSLHDKNIRCATLLVKDVKSRKVRTAGYNVTEEPEVQSIQSR